MSCSWVLFGGSVSTGARLRFSGHDQNAIQWCSGEVLTVEPETLNVKNERSLGDPTDFAGTKTCNSRYIKHMHDFPSLRVPANLADHAHILLHSVTLDSYQARNQKCGLRQV